MEEKSHTLDTIIGIGGIIIGLGIVPGLIAYHVYRSKEETSSNYSVDKKESGKCTNVLTAVKTYTKEVPRESVPLDDDFGYIGTYINLQEGGFTVEVKTSPYNGKLIERYVCRPDSKYCTLTVEQEYRCLPKSNLP